MYAELDTLGKRVKYFREQKKLSQAQLANMVLSKDKNTGELRPIDPSVIGMTKAAKSIKPYPNSGRSKQGNTDGRFYGMAICFTGELSMSREQIANLAAYLQGMTRVANTEKRRI